VAPDGRKIAGRGGEVQMAAACSPPPTR